MTVRDSDVGCPDGTTAWVSEGQMAFFFDPSRKNLSLLYLFESTRSIEKGTQ